MTILFTGQVSRGRGAGGRRAILDAVLAGRRIGPHGQAVAVVGVETRLVVPQARILKIKNAFRGPARVVNAPLAHGFSHGLPPPGEPAGDVFLKDQERREDHHDQRDVFDERLGFHFALT